MENQEKIVLFECIGIIAKGIEDIGYKLDIENETMKVELRQSLHGCNEIVAMLEREKYLKSAEVVKPEKTKVSELEVIVRGSKNKPYFEIKYFDLSDNQMHIGFGSYDLKNVLEWKEECLELIEMEKGGTI